MSDSTKTVDPRVYEDTLDQMLSVLHNANVNGDPWLTAGEITAILRRDFALSIHWHTIRATLKPHHRTLVDRRKRNSDTKYRILTDGQRRLLQAGDPVILVDPEKAVQATIRLHDFLEDLGGTIRVCDPYLDASTIEHLDSCPKSAKVKVLTQKVHRSGKLTRLRKAAESDFSGFELRKVSGGRVLHDRYIIDDHSMLILGASLNGFGKKQSFIIKVGPDFRETMVKEFDRLWSKADPGT